MERYRLTTDWSKATHWVSGNRYDNIDMLSHISLHDDGTVMAIFTDHTEMDVTDMFSASMIESYRSHNILTRC